MTRIETGRGAFNAALDAPKPEPAVFDIPTFCQWAMVSRSTVFAEIKAGRLIARRIGSKSLIPVENARAWLASLPTIRSA